MPFVAYIAVAMIAISGIVLELDWVTRPKIDAGQSVQTASEPAPAKAPAAKADGPNVALSPVYPANHNTTATADAEPADPAPSAAPLISPPPSIVSMPAANTPAIVPPAEAAAGAPQAIPTRAAVPVVPPIAVPVAAASTPSPPAAQPLAKQTQNQCDVQACASAYQSFRASDCTYQPFAGERRVCDSAPGIRRTIASTPDEPNRDAAARKLSKDAELARASRRVKEITEQDAADDDPELPDAGSRVIVIRRDDPRW